jgi:hypothetical protein
LDLWNDATLADHFLHIRWRRQEGFAGAVHGKLTLPLPTLQGVHIGTGDKCSGLF